MISKRVINIELMINRDKLTDKEYIYLFNIIYNKISNKGLKSLNL